MMIKKNKSQEDKIVNALVEISNRDKKGLKVSLIDIMTICFNNFGDNINTIEISGNKTLKETN